MRHDGRGFNDLRNISFETKYIAHHPGSVMVSFGNTRVLTCATIEERVPPHRLNSGGGWLTAEYDMLPASTQTRKRRAATRGKQDGRAIEIQRLIGRSLRNIINLDVIGQRTIHIDCDVIQADGGTRTAAITGAYVALHLLVRDQIMTSKKFNNKSIDYVLNDYLAAVSLGLKDGKVLTDLDYVEDVSIDTDLNLVGRGDGTLIEIQGTAEGAPMTQAQLATLIDDGLDAIKRLVEAQKKALDA